MSFSNFPNALFQDSILNGRYIIKDVLGQGGFGITYKALDYQTREYVAIKEYYPRMIVTRDPSYNVVPQTGQNDHDFDYGRSQFLEEAKTLSEFIGNPGVVKVYSYFEENGTAYFVMEYLEGVSLSEYLRKKGGRIPWQEAWELMLPLMDALSAVHEKKIVHRDIKPDNIIITDDGLTKLLDFGAARYVYGVQSHSLDTVLTPGFAPFEQYFRRGNQGPWTDVYALAATMYCAITGTVPPESAERSYKDTLVLPSSLGTVLPDYAEAAILKALAVHEDNRYRDMDGFKSAVLDGIRREEEEKREKEEKGLRRREEKSREEEEKQREQKEEHQSQYQEKAAESVENKSDIPDSAKQNKKEVNTTPPPVEAKSIFPKGIINIILLLASFSLVVTGVIWVMFGIRYYQQYRLWGDYNGNIGFLEYFSQDIYCRTWSTMGVLTIIFGTMIIIRLFLHKPVWSQFKINIRSVLSILLIIAGIGVFFRDTSITGNIQQYVCGGCISTLGVILFPMDNRGGK